MGKEYTEAQKRASITYAKENLKRVPLDMRKSEYEILKAVAEDAGMKVNSFIKMAISEKIERLKNEEEPGN